MNILTIPFQGTLGTNVGAASDGVLAGALTPIAADKAFLEAHAKTDGKCFTEISNLYTDESTAFNEATGDDVEVLSATMTAEDAVYFGYATTFSGIDVNITTAAVDPVWTGTWEYWNGTAWAALAGVTDATTQFQAATGFKSVTWTVPETWAKNTVDNNYYYWIRMRLSAYTSHTTEPQVGQGYIVVETANSAFTDDTTDASDADAGDCDLLPAYPVEEDAFYFGEDEIFCKVKATLSQERTGTATITWEYYNGSSWATLTVEDNSTGWSAGASTYLVHFEPPSDWAESSVNTEEKYWVRARLSAKTSVTQQPILTQGWVYPLVTGASGITFAETTTLTRVTMLGDTVSGSTADSKFLLVNVTQGTYDSFTWTKALAIDTEVISLAVTSGDELALIQIQEDASTEFAGATFIFTD